MDGGRLRIPTIGRLILQFAGICLVIFFSACSLVRNVPEGSLLLYRVRIVSADSSDRLPNLSANLRQHPNARVFGVFALPLYIYNRTDSTSQSRIARQLRRIGEAPVILDLSQTEQSAISLAGAMEKAGCFGTTCTYRIDTAHRRPMATVTYTIHPGRFFTIDSIQTRIDDPYLRSLPQGNAKQEKGDNLLNPWGERRASLLRAGKRLSPDLLLEERRRLLSLFADIGFRNLSPTHIRFEADTLCGNRAVAVRMYIDSLGPRTRFRSIYVQTGDGKGDSLLMKNMHFRYAADRRRVRPLTLYRNTFIRPGDYYSESAVERTYAALGSLPALSSVSIRFVQDSLLRYDARGFPYREIDTYIYPVPGRSKQLTADIAGTNSAGDLGVAASLGFLHRNLFHGSELLSLKLRAAYETVRLGEGSFLEYGAEAALSFRRLLFPLYSESLRKKANATTNLNVAYNFQRRPEFNRILLSASWIYKWYAYRNPYIRHRLSPVNIDYLHLPFIDPEFRAKLPATAELYNYTDQFIVGVGYVFDFSTNDALVQRDDFFSARFSLSLSGNVLSGISHLFRTERDKLGSYSLFGINFAQFAKLDLDLARSWLLIPGSSVVAHMAMGIAYPYGNSYRIPFELRYFGGGANGVRGWGIRSLGPGRMPSSAVRSIFDQVGDIGLILNLEWRQRLFWRMRFAGFIDAGNIWTLRDYPEQPRGQFRFNTFFEEMAASWGMGLRLDFDFFVVRFDVGFRAWDPALSGRDRLVLGHGNPLNRAAWHFAVGYPF